MMKEIMISPTNRNIYLWSLLNVYKILKQTKLYKNLDKRDKNELHNLYMSLWWKLEVIAIIPGHIKRLMFVFCNKWTGIKNRCISQGINEYEKYSHDFEGIQIELLSWIDLNFFEIKAFLDILARFSSFFLPFRKTGKKGEYFRNQIDYLKQNKDLLPNYADYLSKSMEWYVSLDKYRTNLAHFLAYDLKLIEREVNGKIVLAFYIQNNKYNLSKYKKDVNKELNLIRNGFVNFIEFYKDYFVNYLSKQT